MLLKRLKLRVSDEITKVWNFSLLTSSTSFTVELEFQPVSTAELTVTPGWFLTELFVTAPCSGVLWYGLHLELSDTMHSAFAREHRVHGRSISHYRIQSTDLLLGGAYSLWAFACDISRKPWKLCADCSSLQWSDGVGCEGECCDDYEGKYSELLFSISDNYL